MTVVVVRGCTQECIHPPRAADVLFLLVYVPLSLSLSLDTRVCTAAAPIGSIPGTHGEGDATSALDSLSLSSFESIAQAGLCALLLKRT